MVLSRKNRYALRALLELAKRHGQGHCKVADIARAQSIPPRFLEVILSQLKQGGFVESRRGSEGGYVLARAPAALTVAEVLSFLQGSAEAVEPAEDDGALPPSEVYAFRPLWRLLQERVGEVLRTTTFQDLLESELRGSGQATLNYNI
ncbi:MAG: Rrf2 family transcriptional regulator [Planctomycetes bacterium]|nr:Rrf2 family transcriptional regulator [Planctomycetota bacterium]